jgi:hypothetical protein
MTAETGVAHLSALYAHARECTDVAFDRIDQADLERGPIPDR